MLGDTDVASSKIHTTDSRGSFSGRMLEWSQVRGLGSGLPRLVSFKVFGASACPGVRRTDYHGLVSTQSTHDGHSVHTDAHQRTSLGANNLASE